MIDVLSRTACSVQRIATRSMTFSTGPAFNTGSLAARQVTSLRYAYTSLRMYTRALHTELPWFEAGSMVLELPHIYRDVSVSTVCRPVRLQGAMPRACAGLRLVGWWCGHLYVTYPSARAITTPPGRDVKVSVSPLPMKVRFLVKPTALYSLSW